MTRSPSVRWWPAVLVTTVSAAALGFIWLSDIGLLEQIREVRVVMSVLVGLAATLALALWLIAFSGISKKKGFTALGVLIAAVAAFLMLFRYRGVSGDLVPQFELRLKARASDTDVVGEGGALLEEVRDFPQFLGPNRNGVVTGISLERDWGVAPPRIVWRRPVGVGFSGAVVSGGSFVTQEQHGDEERVVSYQLSSGAQNWVTREAVRYSNSVAGSGPRATPAISDGVVYAAGGTGILKAMDLASGETQWKRDVIGDNGAEVPMYGFSSSPLVIDGMVVVGAGGSEGRSLVAYDAATGERVWAGGDDLSAYSSPLVTELAGVRQIVSLNKDSVTGHELTTGRVLWRQEWNDQASNIAQPLVLPGDRLLLAAGWGVGAQLYRVSKEDGGNFATERLWESIHLKPKFANIVYYDGFVYGLDDGILACLDPETGRRRWKRGRYGHGQVLVAGDMLLVQTEHGEIVLVDPTPEELRELARFRIMDERIWNSPALAGPYFLARNDQEAVLIELPVS